MVSAGGIEKAKRNEGFTFAGTGAPSASEADGPRRGIDGRGWSSSTLSPTSCGCDVVQ
jgi:hypothetical protein